MKPKWTTKVLIIMHRDSRWDGHVVVENWWSGAYWTWTLHRVRWRRYKSLFQESVQIVHFAYFHDVNQREPGKVDWKDMLTEQAKSIQMVCPVVRIDRLLPPLTYCAKQNCDEMPDNTTKQNEKNSCYERYAKDTELDLNLSRTLSASSINSSLSTPRKRLLHQPSHAHILNAVIHQCW